MSKTRTWLDGYLTAWKSKDPADVRAIFTDDAEYWFRPDDPDPARGIDAVIEAWLDPEPTEAQPDLQVLVEDDRVGIISGRVEYPGHASYANLWEVHFAPDGRARKFIEWFMTPRKGDGD
ncbi:nuclear transport factor 2 family protein [uncultured Microbacterium sp.]|uniref:SnoaL-like domain-containing protein n=1 Tax=uncultured Microbacterium sp. TaxID=191216 RepID=A0A1Y5P8C1_9MICO|nr:nuclear transport factor 2 family protein [uncultured Microbacterium sp.]SBS74923.1 conserved hypothetical protein [uncultured Microbacterium sp.]